MSGRARVTLQQARRALERLLRRKLTTDEELQLAWEADNRDALEQLGAIAKDIDHDKLAAMFAVFMLRIIGDPKQAIEAMCNHANNAAKLDGLEEIEIE